MRFQPVKCNMMQLTRKHLNKIQASYTLEGAALENVDNIKYLGVTITNDLKWNTHISNICTKANRTLGFLRRTLFSCPQNVKETAYKGMVRPILEYGTSIWDPHPDKLQEELEKVQNRATRLVTRNYVYETGSMTGILGQLKWESLKKRRKDNRLILLYKGLKGKARIPTDDQRWGQLLLKVIITITITLQFLHYHYHYTLLGNVIITITITLAL